MKSKVKSSPYLNWQYEQEAILIYKTLSEIEHGNRKEHLFLKLAEESLNQSNIWKGKEPNLSSTWVYEPTFKVKFIIFLIKRFGPKSFIDTLSNMKIRGISLYRIGESHSTTASETGEKIHSKIKSGSNLRAAVFGINDGLVSNASLVFALVGANSDQHNIVLTGLAGLLAGGFSMATGEYISVKSQTELYENQITIENEELNEFPEEEAKELSLIYQAKGTDKDTADKLANDIVKDKTKALDTLAREELGINPNELGSPIQAALSSFFSFATGAVVPLLPFVLMTKSTGTTFSLVSSIMALLLIGISISFLTGRSALWSGLRMCILGVFSATITYFIGKLIGISVS